MIMDNQTVNIKECKDGNIVVRINSSGGPDLGLSSLFKTIHDKMDSMRDKQIAWHEGVIKHILWLNLDRYPEPSDAARIKRVMHTNGREDILFDDVFQGHIEFINKEGSYYWEFKPAENKED
jgi:phosphoribosylaminoimidazole (AIR) synthetase